MAKHIAIYGKGGSGKTTIAANLSAALAESGFRVLLVGCSPAADSSHLLVGEKIPIRFSTSQAGAKHQDISKIITTGYRGIGCIEIEESPGGHNCPSRNVAVALRMLKELAVVETYAPDVVVYDMPGDVGCVSEALLAESVNDLSLVVTRADFQSMYAGNRLIGLLSRSQHPDSIALVVNGSVSSFEDSFVADFAGQAGVKVAATIPRSFAVRHSELYGKTVIEFGPLSTHAYAYRKLARLVVEGDSSAAEVNRVTPLDAARLKEWAHKWGRIFGELEFGIIEDGAGI